MYVCVWYRKIFFLSMKTSTNDRSALTFAEWDRQLLRHTCDAGGLLVCLQALQFPKLLQYSISLGSRWGHGSLGPQGTVPEGCVDCNPVHAGYIPQFALRSLVITVWEYLYLPKPDIQDWYIHWLTSCSRGILEKLGVAQLYKKFRVFYRPYGSWHAHKIPPLGSISNQSNRGHTLMFLTFRYILILSL
jgi:hypothetical protein